MQNKTKQSNKLKENLRKIFSCITKNILIFLAVLNLIFFISIIFLSDYSKSLLPLVVINYLTFWIIVFIKLFKNHKRRASLILLFTIVIPLFTIIVVFRVANPFPKIIGSLIILGIIIYYSVILYKYKIKSKSIISRRNGVIVLVIFLIVISIGVFYLTRLPSENKTWIGDEKTLTEKIDNDLVNAKLISKNQFELIEKLETSENFKINAKIISFDDKQIITNYWTSFLKNYYELEELHKEYDSFYENNFETKDELYQKSFMIYYLTFTTNYYSQIKMYTIVKNNLLLSTILNEPIKSKNISTNEYYKLKQKITKSSQLLKSITGDNYLNLIDEKINTKELIETKNVLKNNFSINNKLLKENLILFIYNPFELIEKKTILNWNLFMSAYTNFTMKISSFDTSFNILSNDVLEIKEKLEPGDIILERRNGRITNLFIPGFWTHAAIYVGTMQELNSYFNGITIDDNNFEEYIKLNYPIVYEDLTINKEKGYNKTVIESYNKYVQLKPIELSASADYFSVLRPKLSKKDKLYALISAFDYYGMPYDYDFDFVTDDKIICTELVYKAYRETNNKKGLSFELELFANRLVLTANNFAKRFAQDFNTNKEEFEFVIYINGKRDINGNLIPATTDEFKQSYLRKK
ncbi:MAG: YiiX/YebB-like N1pC/P60 family cysteine hydrolase [archaeon]